MTNMKEYNFALIFKLEHLDINPNDYVEQLYEVGCDDALIGVGKKGFISLDFVRESSSAYEAVKSAINNVKSVITGAQLKSISPDFVGVTELANLFECTRQNMQKFVNKPNFPSPISVHPQKIWHLVDILKWFAENNYDNYKNEELLELSELTMQINIQIESKTSKHSIVKQAEELVAA